MTDLHFTAKSEWFLSGDTIEFAETTHEAITKMVEVGAILHIIYEGVTGIIIAGNMEDFYEVILNPFADSIVPKFQWRRFFIVTVLAHFTAALLSL